MAIVEAFNESVSNGMCHSQVAMKRLEIESGSGQCVLYVVDDTLLDGLDVLWHVVSHQLV